jgi:ABC-type branched-subunit amino acid transport system substrate-binding protein
MKKIILTYFCGLTFAFGQLNDQDYFIEYKKAVQLFANSQYEAATAKLTPLCSKSYSNAVVPYAYFYNALSLKNKGNLYQSRIIFRQLFENYYDWDQIDEARLIYADLNLAENYFEEGIKNLEIIQNKEYQNTKLQILNFYIPKIQSISTLRDLYYKFPTQKIIAENLVKMIQSNRYNSKQDLELSDLLINRFQLKNNKEVSANNKNSIKVSDDSDLEISFGLFLPFNIKVPSEQLTNSRYVFDLYAGMKLANEKLKSEGIDLNLYSFDVIRSKNDFLKFEKTGELKKLDLIFGPLYPDPNQVAADFVQQNKIIQVHPISNNLSLIKDNKNVFLVQPSFEQQAKKSLEYLSKKNLKKSISIFYGGSKKDSLFAYSYSQEAKKKGFVITAFKQFTGVNQKISPQSGHLFFAGDNNLGISFLQSLTRNKINSEVICTASSFNWVNINKNIFTDNVSLIYPEYVDLNKPLVQEFKKNYETFMFAPPSYYSYVGYDMVLHFAKMLKDGKDIFKLNIDSGSYTDDYLLSGFDYSGKLNENEIVPIIKLIDFDWQEIYR